MIARFAYREDGGHLRGLTRTRLQRADSAFEVRDPLLKHIRGWVGNARINVSRFLQGEQTRGAIRALQVVRAGLVDRHGAAARRRFGLVPRVQLTGRESEFVIGCEHKTLLLVCRLERKRRVPRLLLEMLRSAQNDILK